jgi:hypothetical protein
MGWVTMLPSRVQWNRRSVAGLLPRRWWVACAIAIVVAR